MYLQWATGPGTLLFPGSVARPPSARLEPGRSQGCEERERFLEIHRFVQACLLLLQLKHIFSSLQDWNLIDLLWHAPPTPSQVLRPNWEVTFKSVGEPDHLHQHQYYLTWNLYRLANLCKQSRLTDLDIGRLWEWGDKCSQELEPILDCTSTLLLGTEEGGRVELRKWDRLLAPG